jgi:hypothetical protein
MQTIDPKTLRFLALLSAPLFVLIKSKLGIDIPESTQDLLIGTVISYILGSHAKEAVVARANAAGVAAAANVTQGPLADAVVDAIAKGGAQ